MRILGRELTQAKAYRSGTHRSRTPAETLRAFEPLMAHCGVTRLADTTGLDYVGIPVYAAFRPLGRSLSVAQGKGVDRESARASALMEAFETWHAEHIELPLRYDSARSLGRRAAVLDPRPLPTRKGVLFDLDRPCLWVEGWELFADAPCWIPFDLAHVNFVRAMDGQRVFNPSSDGLASGNDLLEATCHALCELIERDASALWFVDPREGSDERTRVDPATIGDPVCRALLDRLSAAGLLFGLYDATSDIGIPCYQAVIFDRPKTPRAMGYFWGFGCHLAPEVALSRAISEAAQCRLIEISGAREDINPDAFLANRDDAELAEMAEMVRLPGPCRFDDRRSLATSSFEGDLEVILQALRGAGVERGALVDLSRPDLGLPVVKAVVPDLERFNHVEGYEPGPRARRWMAQAEGATTV